MHETYDATGPAGEPAIAPRLGIIGGGQLARMTAMTALKLGCDVVVLERNAVSPAATPDDHKKMLMQYCTACHNDRLKTAGYRTYMSGKWHLGHGPGDLPNAHGFDRSLALDASGADNWAPKPYMPYYQDAPWFEDGAPAKMPGRINGSVTCQKICQRLAPRIEACSSKSVDRPR